MKTPRSIFSCNECGSQSQKWLGRCPDCGAWNSFVEERAGAPSGDRRDARPVLGGGSAQRYEDVESLVADRLTTGIGEFDRVLGGGLVPGSLVLLGGEPGIGKSTLLLQAAAAFAGGGPGVSGVERPVLCWAKVEHQIKMRGDRLGTPQRR